MNRIEAHLNVCLGLGDDDIISVRVSDVKDLLSKLGEVRVRNEKLTFECVDLETERDDALSRLDSLKKEQRQDFLQAMKNGASAGEWRKKAKGLESRLATARTTLNGWHRLDAMDLDILLREVETILREPCDHHEWMRQPAIGIDRKCRICKQEVVTIEGTMRVPVPPAVSD